MDFVAVDVETANAFLGSICQIGLVRFCGGVEVESACWLVNPQDYFDPRNSAIHGLTDAAIEGRPPFSGCYPDLAKWLNGSVVVCHTHFDRTSIGRACEAGSLPPPSCNWLDSARVARSVWPDVAQAGYGLKALADRLGISFRHHDALEDARAAGLILLQAIRDSGRPINEWLTFQSSGTGGQRIRRNAEGDGPLAGHSIAFTGALRMPRREAADRAAGLGAVVEAGITRKTTLLVVGDQDLSRLAGQAKSSKHRKAEEMQTAGHPIRIIAEGDFMAFQ